MNKTIKIILIVIGLVLGLGGLLLFGVYSMEVEDMYGNNQDIFYNTNQGDIVINHQAKELGQIAKTWTRFYVVNRKDTVNINEWWDDKNIEIYRFANKSVTGVNLSYEDLDRLRKERKIELLKRLR